MLRPRVYLNTPSHVYRLLMLQLFPVPELRVDFSLDINAVVK